MQLIVHIVETISPKIVYFYAKTTVMAHNNAPDLFLMSRSRNVLRFKYKDEINCIVYSVSL